MDILPLGVLLMFILYNLHVNSCSAQKTCTDANSPHEEGLCGKYIPEMLSLLCDGQYKEKNDLSKRSPSAAHSILDMDAKTFMALAKDAKVHSPAPMAGKLGAFYSKRDATSFLHKREDYYFTGIACECCYHKCDVTEMVDYCKNPKMAMKNLMIIGMML